jgi:hypothetical protein
MGIDHLHTCDGEFNVPAWHAFDVCEAVQRRGLGARLRWYAYCSPAPFNRELAFAMRDAGCAGINFGADSGDETMLRRLRRAYGPEDIIGAAASCHEAGMSVMLDLLLGAPGETRLSLARTIELMKRSGADRIGISAGVRVYPGTELARELGVAEIPAEPVYHLEPDVAEHIFEWLDAEIAGDQRFLFFDPARPGSNYNYTANQVLVDAIRNGHRGAYWDILRAVQT